MKVAYLSVQTRQKDIFFSGKPEVSYAGICVEEYEPLSKKKPNIYVHSQDDIQGFIDRMRYSNLVVCYGTYCFDVLDKYYDSSHPMYYDFSIFDLQGMISDTIETRVYLETVAKSVNMHRDVNNSLACVTMWQQGKTDRLKQSIRKDVSILRKAFDKIMVSKVWELTDPRNDKVYNLDVENWVKVIVDLSRESFHERADEALNRIKDNASKGGRGVPIEDFNISTVRFIVENKGVSEYVDSEGKIRLHIPDPDSQSHF